MYRYICKFLGFAECLLFSVSVMSFPAEGMEGTYKNHIDNVRSYLDSRHPEKFAVFNLSQRQYNVAK